MIRASSRGAIDRIIDKMIDKRYWFVSYQLGDQLLQLVLEMHPLEWLACWHKMKENAFVPSRIAALPVPTILFYKETSKEKYDMLKGHMG